MYVCLYTYSVLVSMCPLSMESRALAAAELPPHFGPTIPEVNSVWLKLYLYHLTGSGPPSFCLTKGEIRLSPDWAMFGIMYSLCDPV